MIPGGVRWIEHSSRTDELRLYWTADWHIGNRACALEMLQDDLKAIEEDDHGFWLGGGDFSECIATDDKRFDPEVVSPDIKVSELGRLGYALGERVRDLMKPIAHKCLGLLYGNHEDKYMKSKDAQMLHAWLCHELGVPDLGYSTIFDLRFRRSGRGGKPPRLVSKSPSSCGDAWSVRVFAHHGAGAAQTPGGKLNTLRKAMDYFPMADLTLLAHVHEQKVEPSVVLDADRECTRIVAKTRRGAISGTYLKTYEDGPATYGEKKLYRPVPLGMTPIYFWPDQRKFRVMA